MAISAAYQIDQIYSERINGLQVQTGDLFCTTDGDTSLLPGQFWRLIGKLIPGAVDHIAIYAGPSGRCVEAGGAGHVISFIVPSGCWEAASMFDRRNMVDELYGIAYPLYGRGFSKDEEREIRLSVARYCLEQAREEKPYNLNFLDSSTEDAFYCSQLAYLAYLRHGIDLNSGVGVPHIPFSESVVFPQEVWSSCQKHVLKEETC